MINDMLDQVVRTLRPGIAQDTESMDSTHSCVS